VENRFVELTQLNFSLLFPVNKELLVQIFGIGLFENTACAVSGYKSGHGPHYTHTLTHTLTRTLTRTLTLSLSLSLSFFPLQKLVLVRKSELCLHILVNGGLEL
jgi:hypothetical protein